MAEFNVISYSGCGTYLITANGYCMMRDSLIEVIDEIGVFYFWGFIAS